MKQKRIERLILVFDANSGKLGAIVDSTKKILMVKGCALCSITHGIAGEKNEWKNCKQELGVPIDYLHRDEIPESLQRIVEGNLPCIVAEVEGENVLLLKPDVLERCRGRVSDLRGRIKFYANANNLELPSEF